MNKYTLHIDFYDLVFLATIITGLNFALQLWFTKKANRGANRYLALALLVMVLWMTGLLGMDLGLGGHWLQLQFSLAIGPLIYFYVLKITRPGYKFRRKDLLHFVPLLLQQGIFFQLNLAMQLATFLSGVIYLHWSSRLIERFYQQIEFNDFNDRYRNHLKWLQRIFSFFGAVWLLWIPYTAFDYLHYHHQSGLYPYYSLYLLLAISMIWIAARVFSRAEAAEQSAACHGSKSSVPAVLKQKGIWLKRVMETHHYFEDPELSVTTLAERLQMQPHELSRVINLALKKNFNDFINEYRVREVVRKMQDPGYDHITLLGIAYESGFNAQSTFSRIFKQATGKAPLEYKNGLKKDFPSYNSRSFTLSATVISNYYATPKWQNGNELNRNYMFKNYLKIAWRNLIRNKVYSALNITGLATGMAVALLIGLWVFNQYSYDRFLPNYRQLYQVKFNTSDPKEGTHTYTGVNLPLANVLRTTIPEIERVAETDWVGYGLSNLKVGDKKLMIASGRVNPDFLKIFQYPFIRGDRNTALKDVYSIIIDESTAKALFGNADPMNKIIRIDNQRDVKVTGVFKNIPSTASLKFGCLQPFSYKQLTEGWMKNAMQEWGNNSFEMFVELRPGVTQEQVSPKIKDLLIKYHPEYKRGKAEVILQPIKDQHLYSNYENGKVVGGFIDYVRMFSVIGALVLLIACINFMNLSTARSEKRAREVGVRKAIGSQRQHLIFQFLTESLIITFVAFLLSVLLVQLALSPFNALAGTLIEIPWGNPAFWAGMLGYVIFTGLLAGSRPAFYLSSFNPVAVLKGAIRVGKTASLPRKILVVGQFSCSVALIISTVIIYQQIQYAKDRPMGYSVNRLVSTFMSNDLANNYDALKNDLMQSHLVESATQASCPLTDIFWHTGIDKWPGKNAGDLGITVGAITVTDNYFKTVGMKLVAGHDFSPNYADDSLNVVVNEAAVQRMGLKQPLNQLINYGGSTNPVRIIGVVHNAQIESPYTAVAPMIFNHGKRPVVMIYRLWAGVSPHDAMAKIGKLFEKYNPAYPFDYLFVDKAYDAKFSLEDLVGKLAGIFAALAIFISCLGLFGLAAYVAEQRTKEIGIRKVMGASIAQIWAMLSRDFVLLVFISCFIATPISLYFLIPWLEKYPYHINIGPAVFLLSAAVALIITLFTISFQAIKAALANPVRSLRSE